MLSGAAANLNQATKALTSQPCKQGKQPFRNRFFQTTHSKTSKCTLLQMASPLIICKPEMLLFKGWKKLALMSTTSSASKPAKLLTHLLHFATKVCAQLHHTQLKWADPAGFKLFWADLAQLFCSSKEAATASIEDLQSLTPASWAQRCCEHSIKSVQASHNSCWHYDSSQGQQPNTVIPTCVAHRLKKHSVTLRAKAFFHFLA